MLEIKSKINELASAWEQFKKLHTDTEKKGMDALTLGHLDRINEAIDLYHSDVKRLEAAIKRPQLSERGVDVGDVCEHKQSMNSYLKTGSEDRIRAIHKKALTVSVDSDGGFFISRGAIDFVNKGMAEYSPMRGVAAITDITGDALEIVEDFDDAATGWVQEAEVRQDTKTPSISKKIIQVHELYAQPKATQKLIDDASIDMEDWITNKLIDAFTKIENQSFISGDGIGKPKGILSYENGIGSSKIEQVPSGKVGVFTAESLFKLYYSLREEFAIRGKFLMNRATVQACRILKDNVSGHYLWNPGLEVGSPPTLLGAEVCTVAEMPAPGNGALAIAFGDFKSGYQIVDRQGVSIMRDPFTEKPFVKFYATKRVGAGVLNGQAIKLLKLS